MTAVTTEAVASAYLAAGSFAGAAKALGMPEATVRFRVSKVSGPVREKSSEARLATVRGWAAERGLLGFEPVLPGYAVKRTTTRYDADDKITATYVTQAKTPGAKAEIPAGHVVKGVSILRDGKGRLVQEWVKTREGRSPEQTFEELREALAGLQDYRAQPTPPPAHVEEDLATVYVCADWHLGLLTWAGDTGRNWDLKLAQQAIGGAVERLVAASPASKQAVVLGLGDLLHADGLDNCTPKSKHVLDVDGRYPKIVLAATRQIVQTAKVALTKHEQVTIRILRGNHDEESAANVAIAVAFHFRTTRG
jgi:hypothetical protein